jgi:hypothetical protein
VFNSRCALAGRVGDEINGVSGPVCGVSSITELNNENGVAHSRFTGTVDAIGEPCGEAKHTFLQVGNVFYVDRALAAGVFWPHAPQREPTDRLAEVHTLHVDSGLERNRAWKVSRLTAFAAWLNPSQLVSNHRRDDWIPPWWRLRAHHGMCLAQSGPSTPTSALGQ